MCFVYIYKILLLDLFKANLIDFFLPQIIFNAILFAKQSKSPFDFAVSIMRLKVFVIAL